MNRCEHCPDGHTVPTTRPWDVWVAAGRDGDGQPTHLCVAPTNGAHVAESDAKWVRELLNNSSVIETMRQWKEAGVTYTQIDEALDMVWGFW